MSRTTPGSLPKIHLLCMETRFIEDFQAASKAFDLPESINIEFHGCALEELPSSIRFDAVVSPANSYARLDGAFDAALSDAFSPKDDFLALTRVAQAVLYKEWRGFAPPGTCTIVPFAFDAPSKNVWECKYLALCPTMKIPQTVEWDREVVYECIWSLMCALDKHNEASASGQTENELITSILMTPLGTGIGELSGKKWAAQTVLAFKHFVDAKENMIKWSQLKPAEIFEYTNELVDTYAL
jgi:O-acetyl-ADP-ribose deacetylase (regulator of RNase III)